MGGYNEGYDDEYYDNYDDGYYENNKVKGKSVKGIKATEPPPRRRRRRQTYRGGGYGMFDFMHAAVAGPAYVNNGNIYGGPVQHNTQNNLHKYLTTVNNVYSPQKTYITKKGKGAKGKKCLKKKNKLEIIQK